MITRNIEIIYGLNLVETTPICGLDAKDEKVFGLSMKNLTDSERMGDIKLIFTSEESLAFFIKKLEEAKNMTTEKDEK